MTNEEFLQGLDERIEILRTTLGQLIKLRDSMMNIPLESARFLSMPQVITNDLAGKTIIEAASIILKEHGIAMHFKEIAREAISRGYVGRKAVSSTTIQSFWATLNRNFKATGNGNYLLPGEGS